MLFLGAAQRTEEVRERGCEAHRVRAWMTTSAYVGELLDGFWRGRGLEPVGAHEVEHFEAGALVVVVGADRIDEHGRINKDHGGARLAAGGSRRPVRRRAELASAPRRGWPPLPRVCLFVEARGSHRSRRGSPSQRTPVAASPRRQHVRTAPRRGAAEVDASSRTYTYISMCMSPEETHAPRLGRLGARPTRPSAARESGV